MRVKEKMWVALWSEKWGHAPRRRGIPSSPLWIEAPWLQGAGQLKCLFMSVGQRGDSVAMFSSYMKGPERSNET